MQRAPPTRVPGHARCVRLRRPDGDVHGDGRAGGEGPVYHLELHLQGPHVSQAATTTHRPAPEALTWWVLRCDWLLLGGW